jgi:hypothetical protein
MRTWKGPESDMLTYVQHSTKVAKQFRVRVVNRREIPVSGENCSGTTSVPDGYRDETVEVTIDLEKLKQMLALKAIRSKGGVAKEASGAVVVKHIRK